MFSSGANKVMKFNRAQLLERRSFKNIAGTYAEEHRPVGGKEISPAQLERFKIELQEKRRRERFLKALLLFVISFSVVTGFILLLR